MKVHWSEIFLIGVLVLGSIASVVSLEVPTTHYIPNPGLPAPRMPGEYRGPTAEQVVLAGDHDATIVETPE